MNLIKTVKAIPPLKIVTQRKEAARLFMRGVEQDALFNKAAHQVRQAAVEAGFYFLRSRAAFEHGEWSEFLGGYRDKISERTVQWYMLLASTQAAFVRYKHPEVKDLDEIKSLAIQEVLLSPLPLNGLLREQRHLLKFGGYFQDDYEKAKKKKRLGNGSDQVEFEFAKLLSPLDALTHFGEDGYEFIYPEGVEEEAFIGEVERKLETALARVREIKKNGHVIEA